MCPPQAWLIRDLGDFRLLTRDTMPRVPCDYTFKRRCVWAKPRAFGVVGAAGGLIRGTSPLEGGALRPLPNSALPRAGF